MLLLQLSQNSDKRNIHLKTILAFNKPVAIDIVHFGLSVAYDLLKDKVPGIREALAKPHCSTFLNPLEMRAARR